MSSREPERPEYERRVLGWLRGHLLGARPGVFHPGGGVWIEDVQLVGAGKGGSVVITFRGLDRPECLFGRKEGAVGPQGPWEDPYRDAPEGWAELVAINFQEDIVSSPGLPRKCDPGSITWI
jgi:hypothetical protein